MFAVSAIADDESGVPQAAAFLKIEAEAYLFINPEYATPEERWKTLLRIHEAVRWDAKELGLSEVGCYIPPNLSKAFHRRLSKLGWQDEPEAWTRKTYHLRSATL